ncbi:MAG TPA: VOC family protein [Pseudolysinimonas sp.]|jgi:catechol 2,3-dioxygenase-like lactoylglutathione lyase family enzyme
MWPALIDHVGILVPDLEEAIERWSAATGYTFSPIARYRTPRYSDHSDATPHFHDARMSFSRQGPPQIELLEVTGSGTHGPEQLGIHHLGFRGIDDPAQRLAELEVLGLRSDGLSLDEQGRLLLCFTDKRDLDGIRLELISPLRGPVVADDGRALPIDPATGRADMWASSSSS